MIIAFSDTGILIFWGGAGLLFTSITLVEKKYAEYTEEGSKEPKISFTRRDDTLGDPRPDVPKSNKYALGLLCCASHYIHFVMLFTEKSHCPE